MTNQPIDRNNIIPFPGPGRAGTALRVRVDLLLMPAPVWRRIVVPGDCTFWDLHVAIQDAFAWEDRHLHQFTLDDHRTGNRMRLGIPSDSGLDETAVLPGWEYRVMHHLAPDGSAILYTYDFGDEWQHEVVLEARQNGEEPARLPRCLAGVGSAPPEDSGGVDQVSLDDVMGPAPFRPDGVVFSDPRQRWHRAFDHD